jgi:hypothetical protein
VEFTQHLESLTNVRRDKAFRDDIPL